MGSRFRGVLAAEHEAEAAKGEQVQVHGLQEAAVKNSPATNPVHPALQLIVAACVHTPVYALSTHTLP